MKNRFIIYLVIIFFDFSGFGQTTTVATGLNYPGYMNVEGEFIYFSQLRAGKISRINYTDPSPVVEDIITGLSNPTGFAFYGNMLYVLQHTDTIGSGGKISKVDLNMTNPIVIDVTPEVGNWYSDVVIKNDMLFVSNPASNTISKLDLTLQAPELTVIASNVWWPFGLAIRGNYLYIAASNGGVITGKISKINISHDNPQVLTVYSGSISPVHLAFNGGDLYFSDFDDNIIRKVHVHTDSPAITEIATNIPQLGGLAFVNGTDLFLAEIFDYKISKIVLGYLSEGEELSKNQIKIYPNPASEVIQISGFEDSKNYKIYDMAGKSVLSGEMPNDGKIEILSLTTGIYFLSVQNGSFTKFLKY